MPEIYVVAGPNGAGKTTLFKKIIPEGVEYINADAIAKTIREKAGGLNVQDIANRETAEIYSAKVSQKKTFSIETNLADTDTYKSLLALKSIGYRINLVFLSTDNVDTCIARVAQRVKQGGHNVNPDVIKARYENGHKLLAYYHRQIDRLTVLDNSSGELSVQLIMENGKIVSLDNNLKNWVKSILSVTDPSSSSASAQTIEEIRSLYRKKGKS